MWSGAHTRLQKIGKIVQPRAPRAKNKPVTNPDPQSASPLFAVFPTEIRLEIFSDAVSSYSDTTKPYPFDSYHYRPGYTAPKRTDLSLLRTCKRVYEETKDLVWKAGNGNGKDSFWWYWPTLEPPTMSWPQRRIGKGLWSYYWPRVHTIHIVTPVFLFQMRGFFNLFAIQTCGLRPQFVKATVLNANDASLSSDPFAFSIAPRDGHEYFPHSVQTFVLELESVEYAEPDVDALVKVIMGNRMVWRWKRRDGVFLELDMDVGVTEWDWMGTELTLFGSRRRVKYIVKVLTFSANPHSGPE
jgi:hypothetical protein